MNRASQLAAALFLTLLVIGAARATDNNSSSTAFLVLPDGVPLSDAIPPTTVSGTNAGTPQWFAFWVEKRRSYVFEVISQGVWHVNVPPQPVPTFFEADATTPLASVALAEITYCDPDSPPFAQVAIRRHSLVNDTDTGKFVLVNITSSLNYQTSESQPFQVRLVDTTLASVRWTTNGYNSFVALHNRSACTANYALIYYDEAGSILLHTTGSLAGRGSLQIAKPASDPQLGGKKGSVEVLLGGAAAGDVIGSVYGLNPLTNGIVQFPLQRRGYATP